MLTGKRREKSNRVANKRAKFFYTLWYDGNRNLPTPTWEEYQAGRFRKWNGSCACHYCKMGRERRSFSMRKRDEYDRDANDL
jgi:hypothetical protein